MEITGVEPILLSHRIPEGERWHLGGLGDEEGIKGVKSDACLLRVHTDAGVVGLGEPSPYGRAPRLRDAVERLEPMLVGEDPFDVDRITDPARQGIGYGAGPDRYVLAGVNVACWDIMGKAAGVPVAKLLGGQYAERVPVYASGGIDWRFLDDPDRLVAEAEAYLDRGFPAFKFRVGPDRRFLDAMAALHDAVGDEMELIVEGNARFRNPPEAVRMAEAFERYGPYWFEEPIDTADREGYRELRESLPGVRIAGGEMKPAAAEFKPWIDGRAYSIVQPDANVMGISETRRVADLARLEGIDCVPHSWHNAVTVAANLQVVASIPNRDMLEFQRTWHWSSPAFRTEILEEPIELDDGHLVVPDAPGLGIELDEDALERYPYEEGPVQEPWDGPESEPRRV